MRLATAAIRRLSLAKKNKKGPPKKNPPPRGFPVQDCFLTRIKKKCPNSLFKTPLKGFCKDFYIIFLYFSWIFCTSRTVHCIFCPSRTVHCVSGSPKPWSKTWPKIWSKSWPKFGPKIWGDRLITGGAGYFECECAIFWTRIFISSMNGWNKHSLQVWFLRCGPRFLNPDLRIRFQVRFFA